MIREPVQSCESWIRDAFIKKDYQECTVKITKMLIELDNIFLLVLFSVILMVGTIALFFIFNIFDLKNELNIIKESV